MARNGAAQLKDPAIASSAALTKLSRPHHCTLNEEIEVQINNGCIDLAACTLMLYTG